MATPVQSKAGEVPQHRIVGGSTGRVIPERAPLLFIERQIDIGARTALVNLDRHAESVEVQYGYRRP